MLTCLTMMFSSWSLEGNPAGNSYDYVNSGDINLAAYVGGKFQFAFKYVSTTEISPTWQIRKVVVE